jgi:hypothetical protein
VADRAGLDQLDSRRQAASATARASRQVPAPKHPKAAVEVTAEPVTEVEAVASSQAERKPVKDRPTRGVADVPQAAPAATRRSRVRQTQVHLDEASEGHLTTLKRQAVMADLPFSASAVLRLALHELVSARGYDGVLAELSEDPSQMRVVPPSGRD